MIFNVSNRSFYCGRKINNLPTMILRSGKTSLRAASRGSKGKIINPFHSLGSNSSYGQMRGALKRIFFVLTYMFSQKPPSSCPNTANPTQETVHKGTCECKSIFKTKCWNRSLKRLKQTHHNPNYKYHRQDSEILKISVSGSISNFKVTEIKKQSQAILKR